MKNVVFKQCYNNLFHYSHQCKTFCTSTRLKAMPVIAPDHVFLEKPNYPEIRDTSKDAKIRYARLDKYEEIKKMRTVPEKMLAVTTSERQKSFLFEGRVNRYGATEFVQHITKTHIVRGLPEQYGSSHAASSASLIKESIVDTILCENFKNEWVLPKWMNQELAEESVPTKSIIEAVLQHITSSFGSEFEHLISGQVTESPRCDAFWWRGNDHTDLQKAAKLKRSLFQVPTFQLNWKPDLLMRTVDPLPPIVDRDDPLCASSDVPYCPYFPSNYSMSLRPKAYLTCTPGFWPGESSCEFPFLSLVSSSAIMEEWKCLHGDYDLYDSLDQAAMVCSFGWLLASATVQGFTPFHELTYPLVGQSIFTDGKTWSFYVYQMNTLALHPDVDKNTHRNICWASGPMNLYEVIEDGQLKGINDEVIKLLISFCLSRPQRLPGVNLKPYLDEESVPEDEKQKNLTLMKNQFDNRLDLSICYHEVPTWHHVYKFNPEAPISPRVKMW